MLRRGFGLDLALVLIAAGFSLLVWERLPDASWLDVALAAALAVVVWRRFSC